MPVHRFPSAAKHSPEARARHYRQVVRELVEAGMEVARAMRAPAKPGPQRAPSLADIAVAYERVARGVRCGIMLLDRIRRPASSEAGAHDLSVRRGVIGEIAEAIRHLQAEPEEPVDGPDVLEDVEHRPIPEIIAEICRDVGLAAIPGLKLGKRQTPDDIAALCELAARAYRAEAGSRAPAIDFPDRPLPKREERS